MLWWPFFFIALLYADDDLTVEKYCFNSLTQMNKAYSQFKAIAVPSDRVEKDEPCLIISARTHRRELIQKYLLSGHPDMNISFSSQEIKRDPCELKVEKVKSIQAKDQNIQVSKYPGARVEEQQGNSTETFQITTLKDFELSVDQDSVRGECRYISPNNYEITLTVEKEAKPLTPPVPPGTIVVVPTTPPNQETSKLKTQLQLQRGSRIEIGSVVKKLKDQGHNASASPKIEMNNDERNLQEKVFLSIN